MSDNCWWRVWFGALAVAAGVGCGGGDAGDAGGDDAAGDVEAATDEGGPEADGPWDGSPDAPDGGDGGADTAADGGDPPTTTLAPVTTDDLFLNPERGFYASLDLVSDRGYGWVRERGFTLAHAYVRLDDYRERDLDAALLEAIAAGFGEARAAGIKVVLRFSYNFGPYPDSEPDAPKDRILRHIEQLAPLLRDHVDVIAVMQAGFIGAWGEWHTSTNGLLDNPRDKFDILEAILDALPASRAVLLRYPPYKRDGYGGPLAEGDAWDGSYAARVGHHNDCFLASDTDYGTYPSDEIDLWKGFVAQETLYVPMQGETCHVNPPRSDCPTALAELERFHWSILNDGYHPDVVAGWAAQGCRPEIERRLGYRLAAVALTYAPRVPPGGVLPLRVTLRNDGWAAPINPRPLNVVLDGASREVALVTGLDPRRWLPGEEIEVAVRLRVPATLAPGSFELALWLPDAAARLRDDARYAIRLANDGAWREASGLNVLASVSIDPSAPGEVDPAATELVVLP
ncbi:MAG: DUF4832 domain-containing protein [Deltaproteobacteria bacterium]|nr:DUF4832 domain-containing protein [Deltaproteobacteria bacterium]